MNSFIETVGRYIDGTLQDDDVHTTDVKFNRVPGTGRETPNGWACDFDVLLEGRRVRITIAVSEAQS